MTVGQVDVEICYIKRSPNLQRGAFPWTCKPHPTPWMLENGDIFPDEGRSEATVLARNVFHERGQCMVKTSFGSKDLEHIASLKKG